MSLTGAGAEAGAAVFRERPGVLGVLGVLGVRPPWSVSEGSFVLSSLLESSSNTDFLERSSRTIAEGCEGLLSKLNLEA